MIGHRNTAATAGLVAWLILAAAQEPPSPPTLEWFHGNWRGEATIFGRPAKVTLTVGPALMSTASTLVYTAEVAAADGHPVFHFEGRGTYRVAKDGRIAGNWSDSQGNFHPLAGKVSGQTMAVTWGEPRTEVGHSRYELGTDGTLKVTDAEFSQGQLRIFASASYRRVP